MTVKKSSGKTFDDSIVRVGLYHLKVILCESVVVSEKSDRMLDEWIKGRSLLRVDVSRFGKDVVGMTSKEFNVGEYLERMFDGWVGLMSPVMRVDGWEFGKAVEWKLVIVMNWSDKISDIWVIKGILVLTVDR